MGEDPFLGIIVMLLLLLILALLNLCYGGLLSASESGIEKYGQRKGAKKTEKVLRLFGQSDRLFDTAWTFSLLAQLWIGWGLYGECCSYLRAWLVVRLGLVLRGDL